MSISPQPKQLEFWESTPNLSEGGIELEKSKRTVPQAGKDVSSKRKLKGSAEENEQLELFVTRGSVLVPSVTILSDNLNTCANDIQRLKSFQKLGQDSILRGENCSPFYNELCSMIFSALSLPTPIGYADLDLNWLGGFANRMSANSWFSTTVNSAPNKSLWQICCPSSTVSLLGFTDSENIEKKLELSYGLITYKKSQKIQPNSVSKIPILPSKELHLVWKQWLAAYRWVYNQCIEFFNSGLSLPKGLSLDQHIQNLQQFHHNEWTKCLGKTRQEAVCEAEQARKQAKRAWIALPKELRGFFNMKFRSCRNKSQVIQFKCDAYKDGTWFPSKVKGLVFCVAAGYQIPLNCDYGTELVYQRGQWKACFPQVREVSTTRSDKVIAFDPGVRAFLTGYDGESILEIGKGDIGRITRLCLHLDSLISKKVRSHGKRNKKKRYKLSKAISKLRFRVQSLVDDLHKKVTNLIVNNYKLVFLPTYETSQMVFKAQRKITKKSVRNMLSWSFGRFASHLEQAAKRKGVLVIRTNESYTSKTCPRCGGIHRKLGGNKVFKCPTCNFTLPRDWVGAVNNMLAALQAIAFTVQGNQLSIGITELGDVGVAQVREDCEA